MPFSKDQLTNIPHILSAPRFTTYLQHCNNDPARALTLYQWNLELSSAFIVPLHLLEVSLRNAVVECLDNIYTVNWPWNQRFIYSLPDFKRNYSPRRDLQSVASRMPNPTTGNVVAELKFAFWEKMFTRRHDTRLWDQHLKTAFPYAPNTMSVQQLREKIFNDINPIRKLRNRIAHHEPIFARNNQDDYNIIYELISYRDTVTAEWMQDIQNVTQLIAKRPQ